MPVAANADGPVLDIRFVQPSSHDDNNCWEDHPVGAVVFCAPAEPEHGGLIAALTLTTESSSDIDVQFESMDLTAIGGIDYVAVDDTVTIKAGDLRATLNIDLIDDLAEEGNEEFAIRVTPPDDVDLGVDYIHVTIVDEESIKLSIRDAQAVEGDENLAIQVNLSEPISWEFSVDVKSYDITATATGGQRDYAAIDRTETRGESFNIDQGIVDDKLDEPDETYRVVLRNPQYVGIDDAEGIMTIVDDDLIELSIGDASGPENASHLEFEVALGTQPELEVRVSYASSDATAFAEEDYQAVSGSLTLPSGTVRQTIRVPLVDDDIAETSETFVVTLSDPEGATLTDATGTGMIRDDDTASTRIRLSTVPARVGEGDGATPVAVTATLNADARSLATEVVVAVEGSGSAAAVDFAEVEDFAITIAAGHRSGAGTFTLTPDDDGVDESDETLAVNGESDLPVTPARVALVDDDETPGLSAADAAGGEAGGTLDFAVTLDGPSAWAVTVSYATRDGTAIAGEDYGAVSGTLTFAAGESRKTASVTVLDDRIAEPDEHFRIELSSPANATLSVDSATGTILDDDADKARTRGLVLVFEPASNPDRQGFVRVINHSDEAGEVLVEAVDDAGMRVGPVALAIGANEARHFNSDDLEAGNADKGLPVGVGAPGVGIWRLELSSGLDVEVLSYARTSDGFVTSLHDTAPATAGLHRAVFLNPAGNTNQVSRLRLVNPGAEDAEVTITGTDDAGGMSADVVVELAAGTAREWTAAELESGTDAEGALGDGDGKWRLRLSSDRPVVALSLIESPTGNLTNLSTLPVTRGVAEGSRAVPLFPSASDAAGRQGFVRVANLSSAVTEVRIEAFDATDWEYDPLGLAADPDEVASFNSDDLEQGNVDKGLTGSTGAGHGDWWLELSSDAEIDVGSYIRTTDGFLTAMHDLVPGSDGEYRVVFFNPGENVNQVSMLWLVNRADADAEVTITGVDDAGDSPGTPVRTTVPAGSSLRLSSTELESGESDAVENGALGDGHGKWRLEVVSDQPIMVMSLLENPTGHLTNLSTATGP